MMESWVLDYLHLGLVEIQKRVDWESLGTEAVLQLFADHLEAQWVEAQ
jgi:hypothetical protein